MNPGNAATTSKPRRRGWFTFSLRTLFVAMTLLACALGWQLNAIRTRRAVREQLVSKGAFSFTTSAEYVRRYPPGMAPPPVPAIPRWRRWLGDEAIAEIWTHPYSNPVNEADRKLATETFPEAEIREWLPEPCHPGCFPAGTLVLTPAGERAIERIAVGDQLSTVNDQGELTPIAVQSVFVTSNRLWRVTTEAGELLTTETQPLCSGTRPQHVTAGNLSPGDRILLLSEEQVCEVVVVQVERTERVEDVFNLVLSNSEVFVAGGYLARSKPPAESASAIAGGEPRQVLPVE